jgi:hypothetical protein
MSRATEITFENWTFVHYTIDGLKSFVSIGANPKTEEIQYFVTVTDIENQEVFQSSHDKIEMALEDINKRYGHWKIFDAENPPEEDGCSSCSAH